MLIDFSTIKILVTDDQPLIRLIVNQSLKAMGFLSENISQAADGTAALCLCARPLDIILCDLKMAPMGGIDLLKEIRCGRTDNYFDLPFVFLSAHPERSTIMTAAQLHVDGFIVKPPTPAEIKSGIQRALERPRLTTNPFNYFQIRTGTAYDDEHFSQASTEPLPRAPGIRCSLKDAKVGMLLARPLFSGTNTRLLLLPLGTRVTQNHLQALTELADKYQVDHLYIEPSQPVKKDTTLSTSNA